MITVLQNQDLNGRKVMVYFHTINHQWMQSINISLTRKNIIKNIHLKMSILIY